MQLPITPVYRLGVALTVSMLAGRLAFADSLPVDNPAVVNQTIRTRTINGGIYYNTPGSRTSFRPKGADGLWLKSGTYVRGLESNGGRPTGNGGTLFLNAPGKVVRLDGDIDVSGLRNGTLYLGNGGTVITNAAFLYQNGRILANGVNGGRILMNVGAATLGPNALLSAQGFGGAGGAVNINAAGGVQIKPGAVIDVSGRVVATVDTTVINIEGGLVNTSGILRANGVVRTAQDTKIALDADHVLSSGQTLDQALIAQHGLTVPQAITVASSSTGGLIRLVASGTPSVAGSPNCPDCALDSAGNPLIAQSGGTPMDAALKNTLKAEHADLLATQNGSIVQHGRLEALGSDAQNGQSAGAGGTVVLAAADSIRNTRLPGDVSEAGPVINVTGGNALLGTEALPQAAGNGGSVVALALGKPALPGSGFLQNDGRIIANGGEGADAATAGHGGLLAFGYRQMVNTGTIDASGARGGLIVFKNGQNPDTLLGTVRANGALAAGTILAADLSLPAQSLNTTTGVNAPIQHIQPNEILVNGQTMVLLPDKLSDTATLSSQIGEAWPTARILEPLDTSRPLNVAVFGQQDGTLSLDHLALPDAPLTPLLLHTMTVLQNERLVNLAGNNGLEGVWRVGQGGADAGHLSWITNGLLQNNGTLLAPGGSIRLGSTDSSIANRGVLSTSVKTGSGQLALGGAIQLQAGTTVRNLGQITADATNDSVPDAMQRPAAAIAGSIRIDAGRDVLLDSAGILSATAINRFNTVAAQTAAPGIADAGVISVNAGETLLNAGAIKANGLSLYDDSDRYGLGFGGTLQLHAGSTLYNGSSDPFKHLAQLIANGSSHGGEITLSAGGADSGTYSDQPETLPGIGISQAYIQGQSTDVGHIDPVWTNRGGGRIFQQGETSVLGFGGTVQPDTLVDMPTRTDGDVRIIAERQVGLSMDGNLNGVTFPVNSLDVSAFARNAFGHGGSLLIAVGSGAVASVLCGQPPLATSPNQSGPPLGEPLVEESPDAALVLPDTIPLRDTSVGQFQEQRLQNNRPDTVESPIPVSPLIAYGKPVMLLSPEYEGVTENLLSQGYRVYVQGLSAGVDKATAFQAAEDFLSRSGITPIVASQLLRQAPPHVQRARPEVRAFLRDLAAPQDDWITQPAASLPMDPDPDPVALR